MRDIWEDRLASARLKLVLVQRQVDAAADGESADIALLAIHAILNADAILAEVKGE